MFLPPDDLWLGTSCATPLDNPICPARSIRAALCTDTRVHMFVAQSAVAARQASPSSGADLHLLRLPIGAIARRLATCLPRCERLPAASRNASVICTDFVAGAARGSAQRPAVRATASWVRRGGNHFANFRAVANNAAAAAVIHVRCRVDATWGAVLRRATSAPCAARLH